jgi:membrane carboxypeptidase/penicillin-binding protein PbpC
MDRDRRELAARLGVPDVIRLLRAVGFTSFDRTASHYGLGISLGNAEVTLAELTGAGPIFHAAMLAAQQHVRGRDVVEEPIVNRPADLLEHDVCQLSGMRAGAACPLRRREWLPASFSPLPCDWHHDSEDGLLTLWPEPYRAWATARGLVARSHRAVAPARIASLARNARATGISGTPPPFGIVSPADGATYLIDPTLRPDFQRLPLRAAAARGRIEWRIDGTVTSNGDWPLARGVHRIEARDASGRIAQSTITVR